MQGNNLLNIANMIKWRLDVEIFYKMNKNNRKKMLFLAFECLKKKN